MPVTYEEDGGFLGGTSTGGRDPNADTYDPNYGQGDGDQNTEPDPPPDDGAPADNDVVVDPDPTDPGPDDTPPVDPPPDDTPPADDYTTPDYTTPDEGGTGGDADFIGDSGIEDYTVPDATDVETPDGSGTAEVEQTNWDVTEEQTVAGQFEDLYNRDSPIFELARQRAIRQHLGSGGQNSAMAAGFGEVAAMDKAFEMAKQDALTYARSAEFNAAMANQYSLAEQRFIHNALLSDQAFEQAKSLQTQRIAAQMELMVMDYKGRSALMDQELDNWFQQASKQFEYDMSKLSFQLEGEKQMINMQALANFYTNGFASVMNIASNPNLTPEQSRKAIENGMTWFNNQLSAFRNILSSNAGQSSSGGQFLSQNWWQGGNTGGGGSTVPADNNGYPNWSDYTTYGQRVSTYTNAVENGEMYWQ